jgi:hypothetical protein
METMNPFGHRIGTILLCLFVLAVANVPITGFSQFGIPCEVCKKFVGESYFYTHDKVTDKKVYVCRTCNDLNDHCFACGLPVLPGGLVLDDGRHYCPRDGALAIIDAKQMAAVVKDTIDQLYFTLRDRMTFPTETVSVDMIDRINIDAMFAKVGHDYACPNLLGYYQTVINQAGEHSHSVHILTGLTPGATRATLAHELTHAWIADNIPEERQLGRLAQEGFCELISYLVVEKLGDTTAMEQIERNAYTRGQFALFKEAKRLYELQTILDWLHYGAQTIIDPKDVDQVRRVTKPAVTRPKLWVRYETPSTNTAAAVKTTTAAPTELVLKGILGNGNRRMAMISGKSFMTGEMGNVLLGDETTAIRCVKIGTDSVRVELISTGEIKELKLRPE